MARRRREPFTPRHAVSISDAEMAELSRLLRRDGHSYGDPLLARLEVMPLVEADGTLSERGQSAARRIVETITVNGVVDGAEELRVALKEERLAEAYLEISLQEGHPGTERSAVVKRRIEAMDRTRDAAIAYIEAAIKYDSGGQAA